jgi:hypothetical protein
MTGPMQPTGLLVHDALRRRLLELVPALQVRGPRGGWTAYYRGHDVILLARVAPDAPTEIDVASPITGWAARLRSSADLDDPGVTTGLVAAVQQAGQLRTSSTGDLGDGPVGAVLAFVVVAASAVDRLRLARRARGDPGDLDTVVAAATIEERRRESSLSLGCATAVGVSILGLLVGLGLAALLRSNLVAMGFVESIAFVGAIAAGLAAMLAIRRRYPSPPQTTLDRLAGRLVLAIVGLVALLAVYAIVKGPDPLPPEQTSWCLGDGAGYVDNAVRTLSIAVTWTAASAPGDANFRRACSTAWDATHR